MSKYGYIHWSIVAFLFGLLYFFGKIKLSIRHFTTFMPLLLLAAFVAVILLLITKERKNSSGMENR